MAFSLVTMCGRFGSIAGSNIAAVLLFSICESWFVLSCIFFLYVLIASHFVMKKLKEIQN